MREQKIPLSKRLRCCGEFVLAGARVADIGCDHGYLGISLLREGKASFVHACDLREQPLNSAKENARRFSVLEQMAFSCADGLQAVNPEEIDTVICAGMGGELMAKILQEAPWLQREGYRLILQPQSTGNILRRRLWEMGFRVEQETLVEENGFLYQVMQASYAESQRPTPGEEYCSAPLYARRDPLLGEYLAQCIEKLTVRIDGLRAARVLQEEALNYYLAAREQLLAMKEELKCQK